MRRNIPSSRKASATQILPPPRRVPEKADMKGTLFRAVRTPLSRAELHQHLNSTIEAWLATVCRWPKDPDYPQFRFLTFTWMPVRGTQLFMHFYCEPGEPVSWEVSSGYIHGPTLRWLWPDRAERIGAFGFQISGQTENFETSVDIRSKKDLTRTARAVVDLLYAALDYRGQQSLTVELQAACGTQTPRLPVFESVTPTRVIEVMIEHGHTLVDVEGDWESPVLRFRRRGIPTTVELGDRHKGSRLFQTLALTCELEPSAVDVARLSAVTHVVASPEADAVIRLGTTLQFGGAVTLDWFHERIKEWDRMTSAYRREQRRGATRVSVAATSEAVH
jgi:hypothetical protein